MFGSIGRLSINRHLRHGLLLALGWSIVWLTRPFEASLLFLFGAFILAGWLLTSRNARSLLEFRGFALGAFAVLTCTAGLTILHNWRVTGTPWLLPYQLSQKQYGVPQSFSFQKIIKDPVLPYQDLEAMYMFQREERKNMDVPGFWLRRLLADLRTMWLFFVNYYFTVPLVIAIVAARSYKYRILMWLCAAAFLASLLYPFFFVHYYAAYTAVLGLLIMLGFKTLWEYRWRTTRAGALIAGVFMVWASLVPFRYVTAETLSGMSAPGPTHPRTTIALDLKRMPGQHLVFVPQESFRREWVYNKADLDSAHVIWARMLSPEKDEQLRRHFAGRYAWSIAGDEDHPILEPREDGPKDLHTEAGRVFLGTPAKGPTLGVGVAR